MHQMVQLAQLKHPLAYQLPTWLEAQVKAANGQATLFVALMVCMLVPVMVPDRVQAAIVPLQLVPP